MTKLSVKRAHNEDLFGDRFRLNYMYRRDERGALICASSVCWIGVGRRRALAVAKGLPATDGAVIRIDESLRRKLQLKEGESADFTFRRAGLISELRWAWSASNPGYRMASRLAAVSLVLGASGLSLGIISLILNT